MIGNDTTHESKRMHYAQVSRQYDARAAHGKFSTLAPHDRGGRKSEYVAALFDAALLPLLAVDTPHDRALDFGCGTGIFTLHASTRSRAVVGIDVSLGMLRFAQTLCATLDNVAFVQTDGSRLPFADASFDLVIAREALCYVPDAHFLNVLGEIRRVVAPGGRVLWLEQVSNDPKWQHHPDAPSLIKRSAGAIRTTAETAGFVVEIERKVRAPRFPWIYPIWLGLVPRIALATLARWEIAWHQRFPGSGKRWWNALFVLRKTP